MKKVLLFFALFLVASCTVVKYVPVIEYKDSVRVETHLHYIRDTIAFYIPEIIEKNVTRDTSSHIENRYAKSDAVVSDGLLSHSLETIPHTEYVPVEVPVHDTLIVEKEAKIIKEEVPAQLTWWQQTRLKGFAWLLIIDIIALAVFFLRKKLLSR